MDYFKKQKYVFLWCLGHKQTDNLFQLIYHFVVRSLCSTVLTDQTLHVNSVY